MGATTSSFSFNDFWCSARLIIFQGSSLRVLWSLFVEYLGFCGPSGFCGRFVVHFVDFLGFVVGKDDDMWRVEPCGVAKQFAENDLAIEEILDDSIDVVHRCGP